MPNQDAPGEFSVSDVGREEEGRGAQAVACWRDASKAAGIEGAVSGARDVADGGRRLEFADAAMLWCARARVLGRRESVWLSTGALLGAGKSPAPVGGGEE